jgi:hypothetical protein
MTRRRWALAGGGAAAAAAAIIGVVTLGGLERSPSGPLSDEGMCQELLQLEVGYALSGEDEVLQVLAVSLLADIGDRAPQDVRPAVVAIAGLAAEEPAVAEVSRRDLDDPSTKAAAFQATYRLRFSQLYREAAARVERFAVERCGMEASGRFDLDVGWELDESLYIELDLEGFEAPTVEFDEAQFEPYELPEFDPPTVQIDPSDFEQFKLQPFEVPSAQAPGGGG